MQNVDDGPLARPDPSLRVRFLTPPRTRFRYTFPCALARLVQWALRADVIVSGSEEGNGLLLGYLAAWLTRRPFVVLVQAHIDESIEQWVPAPLWWVTRRIHARSDAAICVNDSLVAGVVASGLPASRTHVVHNGVDVAAVRGMAGLPGTVTNAANATAPSISPGSVGDHYVPTVVAIGRLTAEKDYSMLIRAHARVCAGRQVHRLLILGEGPARAELEALATELGVRDSVHLPGFAANPYRELSRADLFVLSSRTEAWGLTLLEAEALGVPIVATRCGAAELVLDNGTYGQLVPVGSVDAMATAIESHLREPQVLRARAFGAPGHALNFDIDRSARKALDILASLTGRVAAPNPNAAEHRSK